MIVTSAEFQQDFGRCQDMALHEPVEITKDGRPYTVLLSASTFEVLLKGRIACLVEDLDDDTLEAIGNAAVPTEFASLGCLIEGWVP